VARKQESGSVFGDSVCSVYDAVPM